MGSRKEAQKGRTIYTLMADSCCMAETNTTLESNILQLKNLKKIKKNLGRILFKKILAVVE